ncbi:MAG: hypothetical protein WKF77_12035 [Planctomycetaceae bacterium]
MRARGDRLFAETERRQKELDQVKLELKLERQNKFATDQQSGDTARDWQKLTIDGSADFVNKGTLYFSGKIECPLIARRGGNECFRTLA